MMPFYEAPLGWPGVKTELKEAPKIYQENGNIVRVGGKASR